MSGTCLNMFGMSYFDAEWSFWKKCQSDFWPPFFWSRFGHARTHPPPRGGVSVTVLRSRTKGSKTVIVFFRLKSPNRGLEIQNLISQRYQRPNARDFFLREPRCVCIRFYTFLCLFVTKTVNFDIFVWLTTQKIFQKSKKINFPKIHPESS